MARPSILLITLALVASGCSSRPQPPAPEQLAETLRLVPLRPEEDHHRHADCAPGQVTWTTYRDDLIAFDQPQGDGLRLVVQQPGDTFRIDGQPVTTNENSFFRAYRLACGERTLFLLLIDRQPRFDDGICFCGPIVFEKYTQRNGALFRFAYLTDGSVKKVQALCNEYRAECFEWTHLPIRQTDYFRIAQSIRFHVPEKNPADRRAALIAQSGIEAKLGFLEKGMTRDAILALAGRPDTSTPDTLTYIRDNPHNRQRDITTIPLRDGRFEGFTADSLRSERIPAERGTLDWIRESLENNYPFASVKDEPPLPTADVRLMFDRFVELAPAANAHEWNTLCGAMNNLSERGHTDPRVLPIVRRRFCDLTLDANQALTHLREHDRVRSTPLFVIRADALLKQRAPLSEEETDAGLELNNLISAMPESAPERLATIRHALAHPRPDIRAEGLNRCGELPPGESLAALRLALNDVSPDIRGIAAAAFAETTGTADDLPLLRARLAAESQPSIQAAPAKAGTRLSAPASPAP